MPNLTLKQIDAQIKRTNWRISDIATKYGADSATYRQATAFLFDTKESKDLNGNITYTRTVKKDYENLTHFVTKDDGTTYIAINRNREAKEKFEAKKMEMQPKLTEIETKLKSLEKEISPEIMAKYKTLRSDGIFPILVPVVNKCCGGCRMEIPSSTLDKLKTNKVTQCEHCRRVIYNKD